MDLTLFELTIERAGSDGPSGRGSGDGGRWSDGGGRARSGRELDVRVSDESAEDESGGPSWVTVAKVAVVTATLAAAATALTVWYLRRGRGDDDEDDRGGSPAHELGSTARESSSERSTSGESSGSRVPFRG